MTLAENSNGVGNAGGNDNNGNGGNGGGIPTTAGAVVEVDGDGPSVPSPGIRDIQTRQRKCRLSLKNVE